jgi:hypothetical protein
MWGALLSYVSQKIKLLAPLPDKYKLGNTTDLIMRLHDTPILPQFALASLDITNLYTNVPVAETRKIIATNLEDNQVDPKIRHELLKWYDTITQKNYFSNKGEIFIQKDGLAMGAPTSGLRAEFFLQNFEHIHLTTLADKHRIIKYFRYVNDILLIYASDHTDTQKILDAFNTLHPKHLNSRLSLMETK